MTDGTEPTRESLAWLMWCTSQGYITAEDRHVMTNWFLDDPSTLHPDDVAQRANYLHMADEVIAIASQKSTNDQ